MRLSDLNVTLRARIRKLGAHSPCDRRESDLRLEVLGFAESDDDSPNDINLTLSGLSLLERASHGGPNDPIQLIEGDYHVGGNKYRYRVEVRGEIVKGFWYHWHAVKEFEDQRSAEFLRIRGILEGGEG